MKKTLLFLLLICIAIPNAHAQKYNVMGLIVDGFTYEKIDSVTVRFLNADSTEVERFVNKDEGYNCNFSYTIKAPGKYTLHFSKPGYEDTYKTVNFRYKKYRITGGTFGRVLMRKKQNLTNRTLGEATVTATRIKMVMKGDTLQFNADAFQLREGSMLDQLIAMLPGVELRTGGEIYVNGKKVQSLLVNGEDFFRGDARIALENLPSYMIDKINVYEAKPDLDKLVDKDININKSMLMSHGDNTVMDVRLKRKYSIGWIANGAIGGGTNEHYSAKAFALRFTPQSKLAFMGYSNNVYGNAYYDVNGNWQEPGGSDDLTTHELSSDLMVKDKAGIYKINNFASFKWKEQKSRVYQHSINYLDDKNIDGISQSQSTFRDWYVRDIFEVNYTPKKEQALSALKFKPQFWYNNYRNVYLSRQAEWQERMTERYMGEALDSLFTDGSADIYRKNLISSLQQNQQNEGHYFFTKGEMASSWGLNGCGSLDFNANGFYSLSGNRNLLESADYRQNGMQKRFTDNDAREYNYSGTLDYSIVFNFNEASVHINPMFNYKQQYASSNRDYYKLEGTDLADEPLDRLASMKDALTQYIDDTNSAYADTWKRTYTPGLHLNYYKYDWESQVGQHIDLTLPIRIDWVKYKYRRGLIDTQFRRTYSFFEPELSFKFDRNLKIKGDAKIERHINLSYKLTQSAPSNEYLIDYRDDATPLVVRIGNPGLKESTLHKVAFSISNRRWKEQTDNRRSTNLNWSANYEQWNNLIAQSMRYDLQTGVRTYRPENVNGNWGINSQFQLNSSFDKKNDWNYRLNTNFNYRHSEDYINLLQNTATTKAGTDRFVTSLGFNTGYSHNYYNIWASVNGEWIHAKSERFATQDVFNVNYRISAGMPLPWKLQFSTSLLLNTRYGYADDQFNTKQLIWSARLKRFFFNGRLGMELEAFDLLNKMSSYSYSLNEQMQTETYRNVLKRYVMLNLTFRLNKEPKK